MKYNEKLTRILGISGWSHDHLADLIGVSNSSLGAWVSGDSQPRPEFAAQIDRAYAELVEPLICEIEQRSNALEKSWLQAKIRQLPNDNACPTQSSCYN